MIFEELRLHCSDLQGQLSLYHKQMGLPLLKQSDEHLSFAIGKSTLIFEQNPAAFQPYHFAINIPPKQLSQALEWLKNHRDPLWCTAGYIQNFPNWNAKSIYFYDQDHNIVEFIGREKLGYDSHETFSIDSLIELSEIGLVNRDLDGIFNRLNAEVGLELFDGNTESFAAIGERNALFICVNPKKKNNWFPTDDTPLPADFQTTVNWKGNRFKFLYKNEKLKIERL